MSQIDKIEAIHLKADADKSGIRLLVTGSVHGNEKCGNFAISKVLEQIEKGEMTLLSGEVTFLPCCNPRAFKENKRYIDVNLNRVIGHYDNPQNYEQGLANQIAPHIEWATHVLDIHSYTSDNIPFVFCDRYRDGIVEFGAQTYCENMILDMSKMVSDKGSKAYSSVKTYSLEAGKIACTLEAGQHDAPETPYIAYQSLLNVMSYLGMIDKKFYQERPLKTVVQATDIYYKERPGSHTQRWHNFQSVEAGTVIGKYDDGEEIAVVDECVLYLPRDGEVDAEWFYTSKKVEDIF